MGSIKVERIRARVKAEVARMLQTEVKDPRRGFVTITRVELSRDLREAKVFFSVLGEGAELRRVTRMLKDACGFIQRGVAASLRTRVTPTLCFVHDPSIEGAIRVASILDVVKKEREARGEPEPKPEDFAEDSAEDGGVDDDEDGEGGDDDEGDEDGDDDE